MIPRLSYIEVACDIRLVYDTIVAAAAAAAAAVTTALASDRTATTEGPLLLCGQPAGTQDNEAS